MADAKDVRRFTKRQLNRVARAGFDWNLMIVLAFLLIFGLIMVYSASSYVAVRDFGNQNHYFTRQLIADIIGGAGMIALVFLPYKLYNYNYIFRWTEYGTAFFLPFLTIPFGIESHNASRWVQIPGTPFNFQPAEASKLFMILFMASWLYSLGKKVNENKYFWLSVAAPLPVAGVIYIVTDNLSSAIIVVAICELMLFIHSQDYKRFALLIGIVALLVVIAVVVSENTAGSGNFRLGRIYSWLHPEDTMETTSHQTIQALYAIGNGGIWGKGLGQSVQKISNLPEPHNDMIFAIIVEELGIVGAFALIAMFVVLLWRIYVVARETRETYGFLLTIGVFSHIAVQVVLNIAVATNSMPNTGVSLPFISYGGSSVCFLLAEMGIVFGVNRSNQKDKRK